MMKDNTVNTVQDIITVRVNGNVDEAHVWCEENNFDYTSFGSSFFFEDKDEAVQFKLRWG